ncbi:ABC transporter ATP-binding protein [Georgenia halophila]|uniref:ABC transporter ATP-binding protein n=1 Tax=Georgenia halophila TaxID=620889 RepID=UPI003CD0993C
MSGLTVRDLVVRYGPTTAVDRVDLDVTAGEVLALLGPSGSGKSSLLRAVAGLERLAGGSVAWDGRDVGDVPVHRRGFGLLFQDAQLFPHRSVAGNVGYGLAGQPRQRREARVTELLALVGLEGFGPRAVSTLSGGQAQRVALARSLAPEPRLLLLDEPLSALDRSLRERLTGELHDVLRATGTTALYVTHDHDEAFTVADRVAVLGGGHLVQVDTPARLWRAPASREVAAFLGYGPFLPAELTGKVARTVLGEVPLGHRSPGDESVDPVAIATRSTLSSGDGALVGLGPGALHVTTPRVSRQQFTDSSSVDPVADDDSIRLRAEAGPVVPVVASRFVRGRTEVDVTLPDGQVATAVASGATEIPDRIEVRLDPTATVVVPRR